ncbi:hypothetical protein [Dactylosporangium sp. CA-139066]|uniref:hypothetical protein n=1 Tax=Dactylosporangium sp. CA-139066 TaxID=3239930 RepID=UPI003D92EFEB
MLGLARNRWVLLAALVTGVGVLVWSWSARGDGWLSGLLVNVGTALVLFAPLLLVGWHIERRLDEVSAGQAQIGERQEKTAASIATLAEEVSQTQAELRRTRDELSQAVADRLAATRDADQAMFAEVGEVPTHGTLFTALVRADKLGLTARPGCRVPVHHTNLHLRFVTPTTADQFQEEPDPWDALDMQLEAVNGDVVARLSWPQDQLAEDFLVGLAEAVVEVGQYPGDRRFDAVRVFHDLGELLGLVYRSATGGSVVPLNGVVQFCPPQWVVTDRALVSVGKPGGGYSISVSRIDESQWPKHMAGKPWLDEDSFDVAYEAAAALYGARRLAVQPPGPDDDEPPF